MYFFIIAGAAIPPPEPSAPNPDYVQCPYCKRRFQEHAAERHIPFCKEQNSRIEKKTSATIRTSALNKRLQYKPPMLKKRSGTEGVTSYQPPGASLVQKKSNFSATYTVDEQDSQNYYQPSGTYRSKNIFRSQKLNYSDYLVNNVLFPRFMGNWKYSSANYFVINFLYVVVIIDCIFIASFQTTGSKCINIVVLFVNDKYFLAIQYPVMIFSYIHR